jgi:hypothetical protein
METALRTLLVGDAGVAALIGTRVSWVERPQGSALPAIVLTRVSTIRQYVHGGQSELVESRVQADCWAASYAAAKAVEAAVLAALSGYAGGIFNAIFAESARDGGRENDGPEAIYRVSVDFLVHHTEA